MRIVLNLKKIPYEYVSIPSLGSREYRRLNPQGLMPTLELDGHVVSQSLAIIEFLEERFPTPSVFPTDPILRAQSRAFALSICSELHAITVYRVRSYLNKACALSDKAVSHWYKHWTAQTLNALEANLRSRAIHHPFGFADYPTIADVALVPQLSNARRFNCTLSSYPLLLEIDAKSRRLDAFKNAAPDRQPDFTTSF